MAANHRAKATLENGVTTVKAILEHIMETGLRKDKKTGQTVPAHFIEDLTVNHNGKPVLTAQWGPAVSRNPLLHFNFKGGAKGDKVEISWVDNKKEKDSVTTSIE